MRNRQNLLRNKSLTFWGHLTADLSGSYFESLFGYFRSRNEPAEDIRYEENKVEIYSGC